MQAISSKVAALITDTSIHVLKEQVAMHESLNKCLEEACRKHAESRIVAVRVFG